MSVIACTGWRKPLPNDSLASGRKTWQPGPDGVVYRKIQEKAHQKIGTIPSWERGIPGREISVQICWH
jgi:hypothetical protein